VPMVKTAALSKETMQLQDVTEEHRHAKHEHVKNNGGNKKGYHTSDRTETTHVHTKRMNGYGSTGRMNGHGSTGQAMSVKDILAMRGF
jgi:hypothetical protein